MSEDKLEPCPFCKSPARSWKQGIVRKQLVACSNSECGAYFTKFTPDEWNTRTCKENADPVSTSDALEALSRMHDELGAYMKDAGDADLYGDEDYNKIRAALLDFSRSESTTRNELDRVDGGWFPISEADKSRPILIYSTKSKEIIQVVYFDEFSGWVHKLSGRTFKPSKFMYAPTQEKDDE